MDPTTVIVISCFVGMLFLLAMKVPVGFGMMIVGTVGFALLRSPEIALLIIPRIIFEQTANYTLVILPLFMVTGALVMKADVAPAAFNFAQRCVGHLRGGVAMATVVTCAMFGACTGSSLATSLTIGRLTIPEMKRYGYSDALSCGTIAAAGTLGMLIPPSGMMVIYAFLTEQSIIKLFMAGLVPGLLSALIYVAGIYIYALINPGKAGELAKRFNWNDRLIAMRGTWGIFSLFVIVIGGIYSGFLTVTEAAGAGTVFAFGLMMLRGNRWANIQARFVDGARPPAVLFFLLIGAFVFSLFIAMSGIAQDLSQFIVSWPLGPTATLIVILLLYIPLGMMIEGVSMLLLTLPIVLPTVIGLGYDPIWFGIILIKMCELAAITPPVGIHVFVIKGIAPPGTQVVEIFKGVGIFVILDIITIALLVAFPQIVLWLPNTFH